MFDSTGFDLTGRDCDSRCDFEFPRLNILLPWIFSRQGRKLKRTIELHLRNLIHLESLFHVTMPVIIIYEHFEHYLNFVLLSSNVTFRVV